jgi:hypothetical protein
LIPKQLPFHIFKPKNRASLIEDTIKPKKPGALTIFVQYAEALNLIIPV